MKSKKENIIVAFYILYFGWLFTLTFLTVDDLYQNYFTLAVAVFYFIFLRDYWDPLLFTAFAFFSVINRVVFLNPSLRFETDFEVLKMIPIWLPLSWGTTAVALHKFYVLVNQRLNT